MMFIYRDEYYEGGLRAPGRGRPDHRQAPQRGVGKVTLTFQKEYPKFMNYAGERFEQ